MAAIPFVERPGLLFAGLVVFAIGWLMRSWASRHNMVEVATGAVASATWKAVKTGGKTLEVPQEIKATVQDIASAEGNVARAQKVAGYAARHAAAQVVGVGGAIALIGGLVLVGLGIFWK